MGIFLGYLGEPHVITQADLPGSLESSPQYSTLGHGHEEGCGRVGVMQWETRDWPIADSEVGMWS